MGWVQAYLWLIAVPLSFLAVVLWVFRPGAKERYERDAEIPFHDDDDGQSPSSE